MERAGKPMLEERNPHFVFIQASACESMHSLRDWRVLNLNDPKPESSAPARASRLPAPGQNAPKETHHEPHSLAASGRRPVFFFFSPEGRPMLSVQSGGSASRAGATRTSASTPASPDHLTGGGLWGGGKPNLGRPQSSPPS